MREKGIVPRFVKIIPNYGADLCPPQPKAIIHMDDGLWLCNSVRKVHDHQQAQEASFIGASSLGSLRSTTR